MKLGRMLRPVLFAALLLGSASALAQTPRPQVERAERHYQAGADAYRRRMFREAATEFRAAYDLSGEPSLLFNLGSALAADGQRDAARDALERYLRALPDTPARAAVEARLRELGPATPAPAPVVLAPAAPSPVGPPPPVVTGPSRWMVAGLVVGGVGLVAAGVGAGVYADVDARFDRCVVNACPESERARGEDAAAVALLWGGGALVAVGLVTFLVAPRRSATSAPRAFVLPRSNGISVGATF